MPINIVLNCKSDSILNFISSEAKDSIISGGTPALNFAAYDLSNGSLLKLKTDGTYPFIAPSSYIYMGYGRGWLYSQADTTGLIPNTVQTALGNQSLGYEYSGAAINRKVYSIGERKYLRSELLYPASGNMNSGGMINWDTGSNLTPGEFIYQFSTMRMTRNSGTQANYQWKGERNGQYANLPGGATDSANSLYLKQFTGNLTLDGYKGTTSHEYYANSTAPNRSGAFYSQGWSSIQNTPDGTDGGNIIHSARTGVPYVRENPNDGNPNYLTCNANTISGFTERVRFAKLQDYIGNVTDASQIELLRTDIFMQRNGSIFILANNSVLANATAYCPLVPYSISNNEWTFKLWKGDIASYAGCSIFMLDKYLTVQTQINLPA